MRRLQVRPRYQRLRQAGVTKVARAMARRGLLKLQRTRLVRGFTDRLATVSEADLQRSLGLSELTVDALLRCCVTENPARHFLDEARETAAAVRKHFPECAVRTMEVADAIVRHEFHFLGKTVEFGDEIDWHWQPETGTSWPLLHSDAYGHGFWAAPARPGDVKYPWELNRHQYFFTLAKAYLLSGDVAYACEVGRQLTSWRGANPFRHGIHWTSEMEFAIRIISWCNAFWLLRDCGEFQRTYVLPFLHSLYQHADYLNRTLTTHWLARNNHILGETAGLFVFATLFPMFRESRRWQRKSLRIFSEEIGAQIFPDGVNKEQATGYHRFVLDFLLLVVRLGQLNGVALPPVLYERLEAMLAYEREMIPPDFRTPQVGDCDDGRGFVLSESEDFFDFRPWQEVGASLLGREACYGSGRRLESSLWFLGANPWRQCRGIDRLERPTRSRLFPYGGHAVLRTADDEAWLFFRCGPFGLGGAGSAVHSHADMLAPILYWRGRPLMVDSGTFAYYCNAAIRDRYRATMAHNTFAPRGREQGEMLPIFNWSAVPTGTIDVWNEGDELQRASGQFESPGGFRHRRTLELRGTPLGLAIQDEVETPGGDGPLDWHMHFAPGLEVESSGPMEFAIRSGSEILARLVAEGFEESEAMASTYSPRYGCAEENVTLRLTVRSGQALTRVELR